MYGARAENFPGEILDYFIIDTYILNYFIMDTKQRVATYKVYKKKAFSQEVWRSQTKQRVATSLHTVLPLNPKKYFSTGRHRSR